MTVEELYNLGYYHFTGTNGYPFNYAKAYDYFLQAAELGYSPAMNYMGVMFDQGKGVTQNIQSAVAWFYKALEFDNKNVFAAYNLGVLQFTGRGLPKNMDEAFKCFDIVLKSAKKTKNSAHPYPLSCYYTGVIMMNHYKNKKRAVCFFSDAANYGNIPEAWHNLGWLCESGAMNDSLKSSEITGTAIGFYEKAANLGYIQSMDSVGRLYYLVGMKNEGKFWIEKAAAKGYEPAKKRLKTMKVAESGSIWHLFG